MLTNNNNFHITLLHFLGVLFLFGGFYSQIRTIQPKNAYFNIMFILILRGKNVYGIFFKIKIVKAKKIRWKLTQNNKTPR